MKRALGLFCLITMLLQLVACGGDNDALKRLDGEWGVDVEATIGMTTALDSLSPEARATAVEAGREFLASMSFSFDSSSRSVNMAFVMNDEELTDTLPIRLEAAKGDTLTLKLDDELMTMTFQDDNTVLVVSARDGSTMLLRRK